MIISNDDTIAAIATPPGPGGIGIVRISGPESFSILKQLFSTNRSVPETFISHKMYYGWIRKPQSGELLDEVLVVYMQAPSSYTREDVVEIHCHSSFLILQNILAEIVQLGARLAEPGEFTKRAFLNGRIDLTQAEAVLEVLQAKTSEGLQLAMAQLHGKLHDSLETIRLALLRVLAVIEVAIDFPDEDVEILDTDHIMQIMTDQVRTPFDMLIDASKKGKVYRDGVSVVILGRPNVGKSSLLNQMLREERAIVTSVPGTTRDTIEEYINIKGMPVRIIDTAGIRETVESVEEIGIKRARQKLEEADLLLFLVDASVQPAIEDEQLYRLLEERPHLLLLNKNDIALPDSKAIYQEVFPKSRILQTSTKTGAGLQELEDTIFSEVTGGGMHWDPGHACVLNMRQQRVLLRASEAASAAIDSLERGESADLVAVDIQAVLGHLGDIVGESTPDDVLDVIFEEFCIGK